MTVDDNGEWTTTLPELACGEHTLTATQAVGGVASAASDAVAIEVVCEGENPSENSGSNSGGDAGNDSAGSGNGASGNNSSDSGSDKGSDTGSDTGSDSKGGGVLPNTGSPAYLAALLGLGLGMVLIGIMMAARRGRSQD